MEDYTAEMVKDTISGETMFSPQHVFEFISEKTENQSARVQCRKSRARECSMISTLLQNKEYFDVRAQRSLIKILEGQKQQKEITPYVKYKEENRLLANPMWSILFLWGYLSRERCGEFDFCNYWIANERSKALLQAYFDAWKGARDALLADKDTQFLKELCCYLADRIQKLGKIIEEQAQQLLLDDLAAGRVSGEENGWISSEDMRQYFEKKH